MEHGEIGRSCAKFLLRPVIRFCLRHSLKLQDVTELVKALFVEGARDEMEKRGVETSISRLSVSTGVHRREVVRFLSDDPAPMKTPDLVTRILGQWQQRKYFRTKSGAPRVLVCEGVNSEFAKLVASVSRDVNPYTVLFELERIGAVRRSGDRVTLQRRSYIPQGDAEEGFRLLGNDADDLIAAVEENIFDTPQVPNLHIKTQYDNVSKNDVAKIREWFIREGSAFHQRARNFLSQFDKDINPRVRLSGKPLRIAVGTFSRVEKPVSKTKKVRKKK